MTRVAFITGSGRGMGREIALTFAKKGYRIIVTDINEDNANETVALIQESGGKAFATVCDVTKRRSM